MNTANPKPGISSDAAKQAKNLAQTIAKQVAQQPWEILQQAGRQITGTEQMQRPSMEQTGNNNQIVQENENLLSQRDKVRSQRLMQALQSELDEIKKKKEQSKLIAKQQEQMAKEEQARTVAPLIEPSVRKGRRLFNFGKKTQMQRQQTQTERPIPPSG